MDPGYYTSEKDTMPLVANVDVNAPLHPTRLGSRIIQFGES